MIHLYFCRHGESEANVEGYYAGHIDVPLTDTGREQARQAGLRAKELNIDCIVASPLIRAVDTATIIADQLGIPAANIIFDEVFKERFLGSLQGMPYDFGDEDSAPDAEPMTELKLRAERGLNILQSLNGKNILLVAHGTFGLALEAVVDPNGTYEELPNAHIVQLI